jgi:hypothetical protein
MNVASAATFAAFQPLRLNAASDVAESLATQNQLLGFSLARAIDSLPAGKVNVLVPTAQAIFASLTTAAASDVSSGVTGGMVKSGNSWYFIPSGISNLFTVVPREDGSTLVSTDSSVWVQVNGAALRPFEQSGLNTIVL